MPNTSKFQIDNRVSGIIISIAVLIGVAVLYGPFLFGPDLFFFTDIGSDTITVFWSKYIEGARYWREYGLPGYSFEQGLGMDVLPDHVFRPFQILLELAGIDAMPKLFAVVEALKLLLSAWVLWLYAGLNSFRNDVRILFVLLGTFTGYAILGATWYVFSMTMVQFYLFVYGIDLILIRKKTWVFILSIFLIGSYQVFYLYQFGVFGLGYIVLKYPELLTSFRNRLNDFFLLLKGSIIGLAMALPFLWARLKQTTEGPRLTEASLANNLMTDGAFNPDFPGHFSSFLLRLMGNNTLGIGDNYSGWLNYLEGPLSYVGSIALILSLYFIFVSYPSNKKPLIIGLIWLGINFIPFFRRALWAFQSDYQREVGLMFGFTLLLGFAFGMKHLLEVKFKVKPMLLSGFVVLLVLVFGTSFIAGEVVKQFVVLYVFFAGLSIALLARYRNRPNSRSLVLLVLVVLCEVVIINYPTLNRRPTLKKEDLSKRIFYNDYSKEAVASLPSMDTTFYRTHKLFSSSPTKHVGLNDALVFGFFGSNSYHSFNAQSYIRLYELFGLADFSVESSTRWTGGFVSQPMLMTLVSNRFIVAKTNQTVSPFVKSTYSLRETISDINIYENEYFLPFVTIHTSQIEENEFRKTSLNKRIEAIYNGVIFEESYNSSMPSLDLTGVKEPYTIEEYISDIKDLQSRANLSILHFEPDMIAGSIEVKEKGAALISIPYDKYWKVYLDGNEVETCIMNAGLMGIPELTPGNYSFELKYERAYWNIGKWSFYLGTLLFILLLIGEEFFRRPVNVNEIDKLD